MLYSFNYGGYYYAKKNDKGLSAGHLTMMALGTVIGGSFFLGSSVAINAAGPSILISYILGGVLIYFILYGLSELTVANPHSGSFRTFAAGGIKGIAGSMLIVIFAYAGFEIIGLAASETANPHEIVPRAIRNTVIGLVGFCILSVIVLLPIVPTATLNENVSPMVAALTRLGIGWAGSVMNLVLITAILSSSLAAMFGIGRMMRSLADEGHAPRWIRDKTDVPYQGILF